MSGNVEAWLGGGIYGLLVIFCLQLFRRTKDVDERRDALTATVAEQNRATTEDRNDLLEEMRAMRAELTELQQRMTNHD